MATPTHANPQATEQATPLTSEQLFADGAIRGVRKAAEFSGLSRHEIIALTDAGVVAWFPHGDRGDRMIAKRSLVSYLARLHGASDSPTRQRATGFGRDEVENETMH